MKKKFCLLLTLCVMLTLFVGLALADTLKLDVSRLTIAAGQKYTLTVTDKQCDDGDHAGRVKYTSSKPTVAIVNSSGRITAKGAGTCYITASWGDTSARVKVTVKKAPTSLKLSKSSLTVEVGKTSSVTAKLPSGCKSDVPMVTWSSNKKSVAAVNANGEIEGKAEGVCYVTAKTYNGLKAKVKVTVKKGEAVHRALLIGNAYYDEKGNLYSSPNNISAMKSLLSRTSSDYHITSKLNLTAPGMVSAIKKAFASADGNDVSLLYYCGHGDEYGSFIGVDESALSVSALHEVLKAVPGKVILVLDTCYSGTVIEASGVKAAKPSGASFNNRVISAFRGDVLEDEGNVMASSEQFRQSKFVVITSSAADEESWNVRGGMGGYYHAVNYGFKWTSIFTQYMTEGAGWDMQNDVPVAPLADVNADRKVTLTEIRNYAQPKVNTIMQFISLDIRGDYTMKQDIQIWPANSDYPLFAFN